MAETLAKAYVQIIPTTKGITNELEKELGGSGDTAGKKAGSNFASGFGGALKTVGKITGAALVGTGTAMAAFTKSAVQTGMDFDSAMSQVQATMLKTADEMENEVGTAMITTSDGVKEFSGNLRDFAQFLGSNTAFSATQAAEALNYMALAGYDTQQSMDMLPNVLNLAAAGAMDLGRASDMITDTQTAFGISAERTTQMVDEMAKAASTGNTSVEQLGDAFLTVGGLASELNGGMVTLSDGTTAEVDGIQELEIALTAMANAGVKGSEAGTHMRNMLLKLASPTSDGTEQLEKLGVSVFDAEGNMRSLHDIMGDLSSSLGDLTQEQKIQAISDLFNTRDLASAEALLNAVGEDWDKIGESILDAEGASAEMANIQLDNLAGDITLLQSAFEGLQIAVSDGATPYIRDAVQGLTGLVDGIHDLVSGVDGADKKISDGISNIVKGISEGLPDIMDIFSAIVDGLIEAFPDLISAIIDQMPVLINGVISLVTELATHASEIIMPIIHSLPDMIGQIVDGLIENMPAIVAGLVELAGQIVLELPIIMAQIAVGIVKNLPALFTGILDGVIEGVKGVFGEVGEWLSSDGAQELSGAAEELAGSLELVIDTTSGVSRESANLVFEGQQEIAYYKELAGKLGDVVDENGNVIGGNEELVDFIVNELQEKLGIEMEYQDGVIKNWQEEQEEIQKLIELKARQMQLDAEARQAAQAQESEAQLADTLRDANQNLLEVQQQRASAEQDLNSLMEDAGHWTVAQAIEAFKLQSTLDSLSETERNLQDTRNTALQEYEECVATQTQYASDLAAFTEGRYEDMSSSYQDFIFKVRSGSGEYGQVLADSITDTELKLNTLIEQYENTGNEVYLSQIESAKLQLETLMQSDAEYRNQLISDAEATAEEAKTSGNMVTAGMTEGLAENMSELADQSQKMAQEIIDRANEILGISSPSKVFSDIGGYTIDGLVNGMNGKQGTATAKITSIMAAVVAAAGNYSYVSMMYTIGANLGEGIAEGLDSRSGYISQIAAKAVSKAVESAKEAGDIGSPSRIMREEVGEMLSAGLALGIEDGEGQILEAISNVNRDMQDAYSLTGEVVPEYLSAQSISTMGTAEVAYWDAMMRAISMTGTPSNNTEDYNITINVYGTEGQSTRELAELVSREMKAALRREEAAYA